MIVPPIPAALALFGYSAVGILTAAPARDSLTTGAFGSALLDAAAGLVVAGVGAADSPPVDGDAVPVDEVEGPAGVDENW